MLNNIKENKELETFDDQCLIWWNKKDLINLIYEIINIKILIHIIYQYNSKCQYKV